MAVEPLIYDLGKQWTHRHQRAAGRCPEPPTFPLNSSGTSLASQRSARSTSSAITPGSRQKNHAIDINFYPLGSCTMKYNPKINEVGRPAARLRRTSTRSRIRAPSRARWS